MKLLTKEQQKSYENEKICYICKEKFENKYFKDKKHCKVRDHCNYTGEYRDAVDSICNLKYTVAKKIPIVFHNGSNYDYHFIIKVLAGVFKKQFTCLRENTKKYITSTVPIEKVVTRIDNNRQESTKNISYLFQFIGSARFMVNPLSNLINIFSDETHKIKYKYGHDNKKCKTCRIKYKCCDCFVEYINCNDDLIECKCLCSNNSYQHKFDEKCKERLFNIYKFPTATITYLFYCCKKGV